MSFHSATTLSRLFARSFLPFHFHSISSSVYHRPPFRIQFNFTYLYQQKQMKTNSSWQLIYAVLCILVHLISNNFQCSTASVYNELVYILTQRYRKSLFFSSHHFHGDFVVVVGFSSFFAVPFISSHRFASHQIQFLLVFHSHSSSVTWNKIMKKRRVKF